MRISENAFNAVNSLHFAPVILSEWIVVLSILAALFIALSFLSSKRLGIVRLMGFTAFLLCLLNPSLREEERQYSKDVAVIVADQSPSQNFGQRQQRRDDALSYLQKQIAQGFNDSIELRVIKAPQSSGIKNETLLFAALDQALSDVPQKRRAGVIFLSDGQIHDIPQNTALYERYGPVHALITGDKDDKDRRIQITKAPAYGLVGKEIDVTFMVKDTKNIRSDNAEVLLRMHDGSERILNVQPNTEVTIKVPIENAAQNIFTLETDPIKGEITAANNKAAILVNGVRDRLKVLLVSGMPYSGERTWRNLLKSDPSVDLVHFTILREPEKFDYTPKKELALIPFPFRELFEVKLYDFDLIIFDRYRVNNILPEQYFRNIAKYVRSGGAFLASTGPLFDTHQSIARTALGEILPAQPNGPASNTAYRPTVTDLGTQHPVINSLVWNNKSATEHPQWGQWLRYVPVKNISGDTLLSGPQDQPLLILDRVGDGRVAQLASDNIWLWSRGYDGGGPHAELLRRIVHWLMKEPQLDERRLKTEVQNDKITVGKTIYGDETQESVVVTKPDGTQDIITLVPHNGSLSAKIMANQLGIYSFEDTQQQRIFEIVGALDPLELREVIASSKPLEPIIQATGGASIWLEDTASPYLRSIPQSASKFGGKNWLGLRQNNDYNVQNFKQSPLMPLWLCITFLIFVMTLMWWLEGRSNKHVN